MSSPIIIPFDNNPSTGPNLKSGSYTVPIGKYAKAHVVHPDFAINGVKLFPSINLSVGSTIGAGVRYFLSDCFIVSVTGTKVSSGTGVATATFGFMKDASEVVIGQRSSATVGSTVLATLQNVYTSANAFIRWAGSGAGGGAHANVAVSGEGYQFGPSSDKDFWISSGSVLSGSGYIVTEYNQIS